MVEGKPRKGLMPRPCPCASRPLEVAHFIYLEIRPDELRRRGQRLCDN